MKALLEIKKKTIYTIGALASILSASLAGISMFKIEQTMDVVVNIGHDSSYLKVDSASVYKIGDKAYVTININNLYYKTSIVSVIFDEDTNMFDVKIMGLGRHLIPNTTLNAEVIYGEKHIYELVFNAGV